MNAPGRNDPCPCGSGKKYKKCCLGKHDAEASAHTAGQEQTNQVLQLAIEHQQAGRLQEAAAIYRQVLQVQPDSADALHLLGLVAHKAGQFETALDLISKAIEISPNTPLYYCNVGPVLIDLGLQEQALACYRKAIELQPDYVEAINNVGHLLEQQGCLDEAAVQYQAAVTIRPDYAEANYNLGNVYRANGRLDDALASYRIAVQHKASFPEAHNNIGLVLAEMGRNEEALPSYQEALALRPDFAAAHNNLGAALKVLKRYDEARTHLLLALAIQPNYAEGYCNLGNVEQLTGKLDEAIASYQRALELKPDFAEAEYNLGIALADMGRPDDAMEHYQKAAELDPDFALAYNNIAVLHREKGNYGESIAYSEKALTIDPKLVQPYNNIANALTALGRSREAIPLFREAIRRDPELAGVHSNMLFTMLYDKAVTPAELFAECCNFGEQFENKFIGQWPAHTNTREPERRVKIGYVSGDFRNHAIAYFIEQILANHDKSAFEIYCYYNYAQKDLVTERLRQYADHWREVKVLSDEQMAARIQADGIDILVDLSGHTAYNRLPVFARKPAPVQVTWMGYCGSTGMAAMDYRLTDAHLDPPGMTEQFHTETLVRLPASAIFLPSEEAPEVGRLPAHNGNVFTFASLNNPSKLNEPVIALWSRILKAVPGSRIMLGNSTAKQEKWLLDLFAKYSVELERVVLQPRLSMADYLALHNQIDLGLDPFPYTGGTTTMHAMWMGVPVLTMAGNSTVSRVGAAIMGNFGLPEYVVNDEEEYLERARHLAVHLDEIEEVRHGLRERIASSPASNPAGYTRALESIYRDMWRKWCQQEGR